MPHIHQVEVSERRGDRTLARIDARWGWVPITFVCGFAHDEERHVMHRWYLGPLWRGLVETWRVRALDDELVALEVSIRAAGWRARLLAKLVMEPLARRQLEMIDLLAVAQRKSHEAADWT
jgi:ribosome-associated toxin RatA of RatAB toxin-antitoxin module